MLLTEIERHDGLIILATNRGYDLDASMHRRITLALEFAKPDHLLRADIWRSNIPPEMNLADDVDFKELALTFELTGGFIKVMSICIPCLQWLTHSLAPSLKIQNAILSALSLAVSRDHKSTMINQEDLTTGARLQLRGRLQMLEFSRRTVPVRGLDDLVLSDDIINVIKQIVAFEKARQVLYNQWGFEKVMARDKCTTCLFAGQPGTGNDFFLSFFPTCSVF